MSISKQPLSQSDYEQLKELKTTNNHLQIGCLFVIILLISGALLFHKRHFINEGIIPFLIILALGLFTILFFQSIASLNLENDISDKLKLTGTVTVKKKDFIVDSEYNRIIYYLIIFDDWRIGTKYFVQDYWEKIEIGQVFYIDQTINSELILKLESNNIDFKKGLMLDFNKNV